MGDGQSEGQEGGGGAEAVSAETILVVLAVAILLNLLLVGAILVATRGSRIVARIRARWDRPQRAPDLGESVTSDAMALVDRLSIDGAVSRVPSYDRIFRIASWAFLLTSAFIVAASALWRETLEEIVVLVAVTGAFVVLVHDVLPAGVPRSVRGVLQALVAVAFATLLVVLTGGYASPFVFTFPLIMGGAAIVVGPRAALLLALLTAAAYLLAATVASGIPSSSQVVSTAVNLIALFLLTFIGAAVGREQRRARQAALRLSALDSLTGLYNRPFLFAALEREIARSERSGRGFCVVMLDVDLLKDVNDRYGHHAGDAVLQAVAATVRTRVRTIDVASRYGGDEFVALLPETDPTGGWVVAEKIRLGVKDQAISGLDVRPTVSVGVVSYPTDGRTADALMVSADHAMYNSKRSGRNRVASAPPEPTMVATASELAGRQGEHPG